MRLIIRVRKKGLWGDTERCFDGKTASQRPWRLERLVAAFSNGMQVLGKVSRFLDALNVYGGE